MRTPRSAALALGLALFGPRYALADQPPISGETSEIQRALAAVMRSLGTQRGAGRLSLSSGPPTPANPADRLPSLPLRASDLLALAKTTTDFEAAIARSPGPAAEHAQALFELCRGDASAAVARLEPLVVPGPGKPDWWADLAAAYLARGAENKDPLDAVRAIEAADHALERGPGLPSALFNRALALATAHLHAQAASAWERYLQVEPDPGWAAAARAQFAGFGEPAREEWQDVRRVIWPDEDPGRSPALIRRFPVATSTLIREELILVWSRQRSAGDSVAAAATFAAGLRIAGILRQQTGDGGPLQILEDLRQGSTGAAGARRLAALEQWDRGLTAARALHVGDAARALEQASAQLGESSSLLSDWIAFEQGLLAYRQEDYAAALVIFRRLARTGSHAADVGLSGRLRWMTGLTESVLGRPAEGLLEFRTGLSAYELLGDQEAIAAILMQMADVLTALGRDEQAFASMERSLEIAAALNRGDLHLRVFSAASVLLRRRFPQAALSYQDEALARIRSSSNPFLIGHALLSSAEASLAAGDQQRGMAALAEVRSLMASGAPQVAEAFHTAVLHLEASFVRTTNPQQAIDLLTEALGAFDASGDRYRAIDVRLERGRANLDLGNVDRAEADLRAAAVEVGQRVASITGGAERGAYLRRASAIQSDLARIAVLFRNAADQGLEASDRARSRVFMEVYRGGREPAARANGTADGELSAAVTARLPAGVCLVSFMTQPDRTFAWTLRSDHLRFADLPVPAGELAEQLRVLAAEAVTPHEPATTTLAGMYDRLFKPLASALNGCQRLVIVPDELLEDTPFAALYDSARHRHLGMDAAVVVAPSVSWLLESRRPPGLLTAASKALFVADPALDRTLFPTLDRLPEASREAAAASQRFPNSILLGGDEATIEAFWRFGAAAEIIHFAGHAMARTDRPATAAVLLAPSPDGTNAGVLYSPEIAAHRLPRTRLAVVAACETAREQSAADDSTSSLVKAFLAAGVPTVIGTLWPVSDHVSSTFFAEFYRSLALAGEPGVAFERTLETMRQSSNEALSTPWAWGAFRLTDSILAREPLP